MATTQSDDPNEKVDHPRHYNQHPSNIETIEIIEHLSANLACATKYVWRCGLKQSETPLRDLRSARWYTERENKRCDLFELDDEDPPKTEVVWRALARQLLDKDSDSLLAEWVRALLEYDFVSMIEIIDDAIEELEGQ